VHAADADQLQRTRMVRVPLTADPAIAYFFRFFRIFAMYAFAAAEPFTRRAEERRDFFDRFRDLLPPDDAVFAFLRERFRPDAEREAKERNMLWTAGVC